MWSQVISHKCDPLSHVFWSLEAGRTRATCGSKKHPAPLDGRQTLCRIPLENTNKSPSKISIHVAEHYTYILSPTILAVAAAVGARVGTRTQPTSQVKHIQDNSWAKSAHGPGGVHWPGFEPVDLCWNHAFSDHSLGSNRQISLRIPYQCKSAASPAGWCEWCETGFLWTYIDAPSSITDRKSLGQTCTLRHPTDRYWMILIPMNIPEQRQWIYVRASKQSTCNWPPYKVSLGIDWKWNAAVLDHFHWIPDSCYPSVGPGPSSDSGSCPKHSKATFCLRKALLQLWQRLSGCAAKHPQWSRDVSSNGHHGNHFKIFQTSETHR